MEHQVEHSKTNAPGLSVLQADECLIQIQSNDIWNNHMITVNDGSLIAKGSKAGHFGVVPMSSEELKIRDELEWEVERDLEDEIKDGICRLALRLHQLYQHQKYRNASSPSTPIGTKLQSEKKNAAFTEVNITIRMEEESKIKVCERKNEIHDAGRARNMKLEAKQSKLSPRAKEFNWVATLRSGTSSAAINKKCDVSSGNHTARNSQDGYGNRKQVKRERENFNAGSAQGKVIVHKKHSKLLQLGSKN